MMVWIKDEAEERLLEAGWSKADIKATLDRIKLVTSEMNKPANSWGCRFMANPGALAPDYRSVTCSSAPTPCRQVDGLVRTRYKMYTFVFTLYSNH